MLEHRPHRGTIESMAAGTARHQHGEQDDEKSHCGETCEESCICESSSSASIKACVPLLLWPRAMTVRYISCASVRPGRVRFIRLASSSAMPMSLTKCSTKNPGLKFRCKILGARWSNVQQAAAPPLIDSSMRCRSSPALYPYKRLSQTPTIVAAMTI